MTILETFLSFTRGLPEDRRAAMEATLAALMESYSGDHEFALAELDEIERRLADPAPKFADPAEIAQLFGKPFAE